MLTPPPPPLLRCGIRGGRAAGQREEHLVQARLSEGELGDRDPGPRQPGQRACRRLGAGRAAGRHLCGQGGRIGVQRHRPVQRLGEQPLGGGQVARVGQPDVQRPASD
jgi:hypothetical protein